MTTDTVLALLSLLLSTSLAVFYVLDRRHAKFQLESEYESRLLGWHQEVVQVLLRARHMERSRDSSEHREELAMLSALIEQGRFFFPNIANEHGANKPPAYQGYRNLALDFLVASYNLLDSPASSLTKQKLEMLQRHFTSIIFELVRPKQRLETIRRLTDRYYVKDQSFEDFLQHQDGSVISHIWRG